ncbi:MULTISPECIES: hypothetical protein [unclassified Streptomyces]|uniref:hypothetical protein n=1 Tax=unclassified Streptomyces TaxID=2593676 RepID=UPI00093E9300|nr:hypothetical protein [Streptomyces sp. TSRI0281]OKI35049.1 hypothetical protein A6A29_16645 [Streptomyces sp. TSRI0281]
MPVEPIPCAAPETEPPVPPCCSPGLASTGLCLADGTPIAVLAVTACADCGTDAAAPEVSGWLNLLTGTFAAGPPPVGSEACVGQPQQFEVGQWCDLDAAGEVIAPVLVEYEYDDTGQLIGVRTLTPAGDPYAVVGTLGICPGAVNDVEYVVLCDTGTDGTVTEFLRQLTPTGDGTSSTSDTLLDGTTAYTPVGRVGTCGGSLVPCGTGTGGTPGVSGPIVSGNEELSSVALSRPISPATEHEVPGMGALITGGTWHLPATKCGVSTSGQDHGLGALRLPAVPRPLCDAGTVTVTIRLNYAQEGPDAGQASTGALFLMYHQPDGSAVQAGGHAFPQNTPAGSSGTREVTATIPADRLAVGQVYAVVSAETWQKSFNVAAKCKAWTFSEWSAEFAYDVTGCPDLPPPPLAQLVKVCPTDPIPVTVEPGKDTEVAVLCNNDEDGTVTQFLRAYQVDSESGQVGVVADTLLDGTTPFEPLGRVGVCPQPSRVCESHLLCDVAPLPVQVPAGGGTTGTLPNGVTYTRAGGTWMLGQPWWLMNQATQTWTFDTLVSVQWGVQIRRNIDCLVLPEGTEVVALAPVHTYNAASRTLCTTAASNNTSVSTFRHPSTTELTFNGPGVAPFLGRMIGLVDVAPPTIPFLRTTCRDSEGDVLDVTDTTLDGTTAYTSTGTVGVCHPPEAEPCASTVETLRLCDLDPTVEPGDDGRRCAVPFLRHLVHDCAGTLAETRDTAMDGTTPYTPVEVVDCGSGGVPALRELVWPQSGIAEDPAGTVQHDFIYTVTNPETGEAAQVRLHASSPASGACGAYNPASPVFNNPTTYTLTLSSAAQEMTTFRLDLLDFDTFEGVTGLNPLPSRVEGDVTWTGSTIRANVSNTTAYVYWDAPPPTIAYRYGNTGGGNACSAVRFQGTTLLPDGCCGCGDGTEPCRDTSSTLLCDTAAQEAQTVFDPSSRPGADGWQVVSYTGVDPAVPAESALPYDAPHPAGSPAFMGARSDLYAGAGPGWPGYDIAPHRWILRKVFEAPEDGVAVVTSAGFRGDGGARVRVNGIDAGMYGQWNQPATTGTAQMPVTAGPNVVEIEVRDGAGSNWVQGRLDIVMTRTVEFLRRQVTDCETGAVLSTTDTTLDGEPYEVTGEVGQCTPAAECCEQPPPELRVDVEADVMCIRDAGGDVTGQVLVERLYDDQSGDRTAQRLTDPTTGNAVELPAGAELVLCQEPAYPDVEALQLCDTVGEADPVPFLRHLVYTGEATAPTVLDTLLDGTTPYTVAGAVGACDSPCRAHVVEACRWDDTDGDGVGDVRYVELVSVDGCTGVLTPVGTYLPDMTGPYEPVAPVDDGPVAGAPAARGVQAHRVLLPAGASWDAATVPLLQSVAVVAHGTGQVTTVDGPSALAAGESIGWSVARDSDAGLTGPLTVSAIDGPVAVAWTRSVTL